MVCKQCKINPVIQLTNSNIKLCKNCFFRYFEKKVFKTIRQYKLIDKKDKKIAVACSGGKDSTVALYILNKFASKRRNLELIAISIDEGTKGYSQENLKFVKKYCKENKIKHKIYNFEKGLTTDKIAKKVENACNCCAILKRRMLNSKAKTLKVDKIATGHNLDDEAQTILMNQFKRKMDVSARLGPITGVIRTKEFIPRIKPLYFLSENEIKIYANLKGFEIHKKRCPYAYLSYRNDVMDFLNKFEEKHPGTKNSIVNSFIEILPLLKEHYKTSKKINLCKICKEPCSKEICKACEVLKKLK